jgi:hypothetical protein
MQECFVPVRQIFFKTSLKIEENVQKSLRSSYDLGYSFHGGGLLIVFLSTAILSGFPRLFYPFWGFWNRLHSFVTPFEHPPDTL